MDLLAVTAPDSTAVLAPADAPTRLYQAFLSGRRPNTLAAYSRDLAEFAAFVGAASGPSGLAHVMQLPHGDANGVLLAYRAAMLDSGLTPATINRRLTAVRAAVKLGRTLGMTNWVPEVASLKVQAYRDTRGPGLSGTKTLLRQAQSQNDVKAYRDTAIIRLFFDLGLRRCEVASLDVEHVQCDAGRVWILGKGRSQRETRTLPAATTQAISDWLRVRSSVSLPGEEALFVNLSRSARGRRITGRGLHVVISRIGTEVGLKVWPHGLRHASITAALDVLNGDVRAAQQHARHSSPETTMRYDDNRNDIAGNVARRLSEVL